MASSFCRSSESAWLCVGFLSSAAAAAIEGCESSLLGLGTWDLSAGDELVEVWGGCVELGRRWQSGGRVMTRFGRRRTGLVTCIIVLVSNQSRLDEVISFTYVAPNS